MRKKKKKERKDEMTLSFFFIKIIFRPVDVWSFGICCMEMANGHPPNRQSSISVKRKTKKLLIGKTC